MPALHFHHCFTVQQQSNAAPDKEPEPALLLQLRKFASGWQLRLLRTAAEPPSAVEVLCVPVHVVRDVVVGFTANKVLSSNTNPCYPFALFIADTPRPVLLSTDSDVERSDIVAAIASAQDGSLAPCVPIVRRSVLQQESLTGWGRFVLLTSSRLLLFAPGVAAAGDAHELGVRGHAMWQPKLDPYAALRVSAVHAEALAAQDPRFSVRHSGGELTFLASDATEAAEWVEALTHIALSSGVVKAEDVDALLKGCGRTAVSSPARAPATQVSSPARAPATQVSSPARAPAPDEDDVLGDAQDDDGAAMLARVEALLQETEPRGSAVQGLSQRLLSDLPQPKGAEDDLSRLGRSIAIDCLEDDLARLSRKVKILDAGDREVIGFTAVATKPTIPVRAGVVSGVATSEQIKELSTRTGRKYEDCKEALNKNNCDLETAAYALAAEAAAAAEEVAAKKAAAESLQAAFDAATEGVKTLDGVSTELQLRLYGLFKQATSGDAPMKSSAGMFDVKGQKKWAAWAAVRGQLAATAQASYLELARTLLPPGSLPMSAAPSAACLSGSAPKPSAACLSGSAPKPSAACLSGSAPQPPPVAEAPIEAATDAAAAAAIAPGTTAGDGVPSSTGLAAPEAVGMRLAREGALAEQEGAILLTELAAVDETLGAVGLRLARRMALIAKHAAAGDVPSATALRPPLGRNGSVTDGGLSGSSSGAPCVSLEQLDNSSHHRLRAIAISERSTHMTLLDEHASRLAKWDRLVETVAMLPTESSREEGYLTRSVALETALRLGAQFLPAWRPGDRVDDKAADDLKPLPSVPVVLMIDVLRAKFFILEDGQVRRTWPLEAMSTFYLDYRAAHLRTVTAGVAISLERSVPSELPSLPPGGELDTNVPPAACCFGVPAAAGAAACTGGRTDAAGVPVEEEEGSVYAAPVLPLYTDAPEERVRLLAALRAAACGRPCMPCAPVHSGSLMRETATRYWAGCHAVLLPSYLLLLERVDSEVPFRVLPLSEAECFYPESKGSLVFTIQATRWQLNFSARDGANRLTWLDALGKVMPVGRTAADGTLSAFRRPRTAPAARYEAISTALVRLRVLQRELGYAEETLEEAQREADAKVALAAARLQPQGGLFGGQGSSMGRWMGRSPAGLRGPAASTNGFAIALDPAPSVADSPLIARRMVQTADGTIALQAPDGTIIAGGASPSLMTSPRWAINVALEKVIVTPLKELERAGVEIEQQRSHEYFQAQQLVVLNTALRAEMSNVEKEIRLLQHAVVLLSTAEWRRGEWVWCARLANARTLWEVWHRSHEQHRRLLAAQTAAHALAASAAQSLHGGDGLKPEEPSVWAVISNEKGIGIDGTHKMSIETRREAAANHDEDWFVNFATQLFEL